MISGRDVSCPGRCGLSARTRLATTHTGRVAKVRDGLRGSAQDVAQAARCAHADAEFLCDDAVWLVTSP